MEKTFAAVNQYLVSRAFDVSTSLFTHDALHKLMTEHECHLHSLAPVINRKKNSRHAASDSARLHQQKKVKEIFLFC